LQRGMEVEAEVPDNIRAPGRLGLIDLKKTAEKSNYKKNSFAGVRNRLVERRKKIESYLANYSYLSASTGSRREARRAGTIPLITPTSSRTAADPITAIAEMRR